MRGEEFCTTKERLAELAGQRGTGMRGRLAGWMYGFKGPWTETGIGTYSLMLV